ncbi:MAG: hypothetical protein U0176_17045 [Bacteroidia bacterium]
MLITFANPRSALAAINPYYVMLSINSKISDPENLYWIHGCIEENRTLTMQSLEQAPMNDAETIKELEDQIARFSNQMTQIENDIEGKRTQSFNFSREEIYSRLWAV